MKPVYIMYDGQHNIVGFAYTIDGRPALLTSLNVRSPYRGNGHARALLRAVCIDADREMRDLLLSVDPDPDIDSDRLVKLYESYGFVMLKDKQTMRRTWRRAIPEQRSGQNERTSRNFR